MCSLGVKPSPAVITIAERCNSPSRKETDFNRQPQEAYAALKTQHRITSGNLLAFRSWCAENADLVKQVRQLSCWPSPIIFPYYFGIDREIAVAAFMHPVKLSMPFFMLLTSSLSIAKPVLLFFTSCTVAPSCGTKARVGLSAAKYSNPCRV